MKIKNVIKLAYLFIIIGIVWVLFIYFQHWNELLTHKQWFLLTWKPTLLLLISYAIFIYLQYKKETGIWK